MKNMNISKTNAFIISVGALVDEDKMIVEASATGMNSFNHCNEKEKQLLYFEEDCSMDKLLNSVDLIVSKGDYRQILIVSKEAHALEISKAIRLHFAKNTEFVHLRAYVKNGIAMVKEKLFKPRNLSSFVLQSSIFVTAPNHEHMAVLCPQQGCSV